MESGPGQYKHTYTFNTPYYQNKRVWVNVDIGSKVEKHEGWKTLHENVCILGWRGNVCNSDVARDDFVLNKMYVNLDVCWCTDVDLRWWSYKLCWHCPVHNVGFHEKKVISWSQTVLVTASSTPQYSVSTLNLKMIVWCLEDQDKRLSLVNIQ